MQGELDEGREGGKEERKEGIKGRKRERKKVRSPISVASLGFVAITQVSVGPPSSHRPLFHLTRER